MKNNHSTLISDYLKESEEWATAIGKGEQWRKIYEEERKTKRILESVEIANKVNGYIILV